MSVAEHSADPQAGAKAFEGDIAALPIPELLQFIHISGRAYLDAIVLRHLSQDEIGSARQAPPTLAGNLLLRACDGRTTARGLIATLRIDERQLFRELELLVGTRWIGFVSGEELFRRRILE